MVSQRLLFALLCIYCLCSNSNLYAQTSCPNILTVTNTNDDGPGSLREALECANSTSGANTIQFEITGATPHIIYVGETTTEPLVIFDAQTTIDADANTVLGIADAPRVILDGSRGNWNEPVNGLFVTADNCTIKGLGIRNFPFNGIDVFDAQAVTITNNAIYSNGAAQDFYSSVNPSGPYEGSGVRIRGESRFCILTSNIIGAESISGFPAGGNEYAGILIEGAAKQNFIGRNSDWNARNTIVHNAVGVELNNVSACPINHNRFVCNTEAIKLTNGANAEIASPSVTTATSEFMAGTAPANSSVELFLLRPNEREACPDTGCQGYQYLTTVFADANGIWQHANTIDLGSFDMLTVTATDAQFNTSVFSACRSIINTEATFCGSEVITVTNTNDDGDGSLRAAIDCANLTPGANTIEFDIPGSGPHIIYVGSTTGEPLPTLTDDGTIIDGGTQSGFGANFDFRPQIILDGGQYNWTLPINTLLIQNANNTEIYALEIRNWPDDGIDIYQSDNCIIGRANRGNVIYDCGWEQDFFDGANPIGPWNGCAIALQRGSDNCIISGNRLGTNYDQNYSPGNEYCGVIILTSSRNNTIGGNTAQDGNIIANNERGVRMSTGVRGCRVLQNSFVCNDLIGIELANSSNFSQASPVISEVNTNTISGTANEADYIEVYLSSTDCLDDACQGTTLLGVATAISREGSWSINIADNTLPSEGFIVGTATSTEGNTSEFSTCTSLSELACADFTLTIPEIRNASCDINNGTITLSATGGTPPYRYTIVEADQTGNNPVFENLSTGTYTAVAIDDANCRTRLTFQIGELAPLTANFTNLTTANCGNATGSFQVTAQGGTPPYSYNIGSGENSTGIFTALGPETYAVTITDATNCQLIESVSISDFSNFRLSASSIQNSSCDNANGAVSLITSGGTSPYFFTLDGRTSTSPFFDNLASGTYSILAVDANGCVDEISINIAEQAGLSISTTTQDANCDQTGGSITITPSNGTPPITYDYGNGATQNNVLTNLNAGTYFVTATDATDCSVVEVVIVNAAEELDIQITGNTAATCGLSNGSFGVLVNSGTPPFSYNYGTGATRNNIFTNIAPGTYILTVTDAAGCETTENVVVTSTPEVVAIAANIIPANCNMLGQVSIFASGTFPFSFDIGNGASPNPIFTNLNAGNYEISVTDAVGCMTAVPVSIPDNSANIDLRINTIDATCGDANGGISISVSNGNAPYSYSVNGLETNSPFINNLGSGTYTLRVTDTDGCSKTENFTIAQSGTGVVASIGTIQDASCGEANGALIINPIGGRPPYIFELGGVSNNTGFFENLSGAIYNIQVTDADDCTDVVTATVNTTPNLLFNTSEIGTNCGQDDGILSVNVLSGTPPFTYNIGTGITTIPTFTNLATGVYTLTVTDNNGCEKTEIIEIGGSSPALVASIGTILDATCGQQNGGFSVSVANGSGSYTYDIGNGTLPSPFPIFSNLVGGTYQVTITDNETACTTTLDVTINDLDSTVRATFSQVQSASCGQSNGAFVINAAGGNPPYSYAIPGQSSTTPSFTNLSGGTYNVTITDTNNCQAIESIRIEESDPLLIAIGSQSNATCEQENGAFSVTVNSGTPPYSYNIGRGSTPNSTFSNLAVATYFLTVTDNAGCTAVESVTILPAANNLFANTSNITDATCNENNGSFTVNANGGTPPYSYNIGNGTTNNPVFSNLAAGIYNITITDVLGCEESLSVTIEESGSSVEVNFNNIQTETCGQGNGGFSIIATGGDAPYTYQVSGQALSSNPDFNNLGSGIYDVLVTDNNGCETFAQISVPATVSLVSNIVDVTDANCGQANGAFNIEILSGTPPYEFIVNGSNFDTPNFSGLSADLYNVVVIDANECITSTNVTINDSGSEIVTDVFSLQNATCNEDNGSFTLNNIGGQAPYSYTLNGQTQSSNVFENLAVGTYTVFINDANGCEASETLSIINESPALQAEITSNSDAKCGQPNGSFSIEVSNGTPPYLYNFNGTLTSTSVFENLNTGVYNVTVTDASGCEDIVTTIIAQLGSTDALEVNLGNIADASCELANGGFSVNVNGGLEPYSYDIGDGTSENPSFSNLNSGTYNLTVTDANGCTGTQEVTINQLETTLAAAVSNQQIATCGQSNGSFGINTTGGQPPYTYDIGFGTTLNPVFNNVSGGMYFVTVTDAANCTSVVSIDIEETIPVTAAIVNNTPANCAQDNGAFTVSINSGQAPFTYDIGNGASQNPTFSNLAVGAYTVTVTDANGCSTTELVNIDQSTEGILAEVNNITDAICGEANGSFFVNVTTGTAPFTYNIGNGNTTSPSFNNLSAGDYTLNIFDANGCTTTQQITIEDTDAINASLINVQDATCGEANATFEVEVNGGTAPFAYDIGFGASDSPIFENLNAGNYTVRISDANGCTTTQAITLEASSDVSTFITTQTDATCSESNGSVTIGVSAGQAPFSYNIGFGDTADPNFGNLAAGDYMITVTDANGCATNQSVTIEQDLEALEATIDQLTDTSCGRANGSFTVNVISGTAPFTYDIGNGISVNPVFDNLASGMYSLSIADASGCNSVQQVNIADTGDIMASINALEEATCGDANGRFEIEMMGGTAPFTYDIGQGNTQNPIFDNLAAGTYEVSISDATGCFTMEMVEIEDNGVVSAFIAVQTPSECNLANGSVTMAVSSGSAPFNYDIGGGNTFNPTFSNLDVGNYNITITDANNCSTTQTVTIEQDENSLRTSITDIQNALCGQANGGFTIAVNAGAVPFSYDIGNGASNSPTFTNLAGGSYTVSITDANGCMNEEFIFIEDTGEVSASLGLVTDANCGQANGAFSVNVNSGTPPYRYDVGEGQVDTPTFNDLPAGDFVLTITDANACETTQSVTINDGTPVAALIAQQRNATCGEDNGSFTIVTTSGAAPFQFNIGTGNTSNPNFSGLAEAEYSVTITDNNGCEATQAVTIERESNSLAFSIDSQTDATCGQADASFMVSVSSGDAPFSYDLGDGASLSPNFTNLSSGTYELTVTDANGCTAVESILINEIGSSITASATDVTTATCGQSNATFTINAANGLPPYSYNIGFGERNEATFNNVSGGVYFVTITDANGCQATQEVVVEETTPLTIDILTQQNASCEDANASFAVVINTGTPPYSYNIGAGATSDSIFTNLDTGSYSLLVTDANGCTTNETVTIDTSPNLDVQVINQLDAICGQDNGAFTLDVTGGVPPYVYDFNGASTNEPTFENLAGGIYEVTIHDANGCFITQSINIPELNDITVFLGNRNDTSCGETNGAFTILANGGTPPYAYDYGNGATNSPNFSNLEAGEYNVTITDNNGCSALQNIIIADSEPLNGSITSIQNDNCSQAIGAFSVLTSGGQAPYTFDIGNGATTNGNFDELTAGTYGLTITDATGCFFMETIEIADVGSIEVALMAQNDPSCSGDDGSFSVEVSGGTAPFTFDIGNGNTSNPNFEALLSGSYVVSVSDANGCFNTLEVELAASTVNITTSISEIVNATCEQANASFTINATGGQAPYTYDIGNGATTNPNFTELGAGDYEVSITDANGCVTTRLVSLASNNVLAVQVENLLNDACSDGNGSFNIVPQNGTPPYRYDIGAGERFFGNFNKLPADTYSVTVTDANGCNNVQDVTIRPDNGVSINMTNQVNASCGNPTGSISVELQSGRPPFVYNIGEGGRLAPNFNNLLPGDYTLTVTDFAGCTGELEFSIGDNPPPFVSIFGTNTANCGANDGTFSVSVAGGTAPYRYDIGEGITIDPVFEGLSGGTYTVTVTDANDCRVEAGVSIPVVGDAPRASFIMDTVGYFVEAVNTSIDANEFVWTMGDGTTVNQRNVLHDYNANGLYELCLTAINECGEDTFCREVTIVGDVSVTEIGGMIFTETQAPIGNVIVNCTDVGDVDTQFDGIYAFGNVEMGRSYTLRPSKADNLLNGINTFDLFLIRNHVLSIDTIESPYQLIAADLNNSGDVTAFDEVLLRQLLLGVITELPNDNTAWRFVDASFEFPDPSDPWATPFPEEIIVDNLDSLIDDANFIGIKVGDVNGSAINNGFQNVGGRSSEQKWLQAQLSPERDEVLITVPNGLAGAQFTLEFDSDKLEVQDVVLGNLQALDENNFNFQQLSDGKIAVSWNNYDRTLQGGTLLKLQVEIDEKIDFDQIFQITSDMIRSEAYTYEYERVQIHELGIQNSAEAATPLQVYQNRPNPFSVSTQIPFYLPKTGEVSLTLYDIKGRILAEATSEFEAGEQVWEIFRNDLSVGVIYYRIATAEEAVTRKMIITH